MIEKSGTFSCPIELTIDIDKLQEFIKDLSVALIQDKFTEIADEIIINDAEWNDDTTFCIHGSYEGTFNHKHYFGSYSEPDEVELELNPDNITKSDIQRYFDEHLPDILQGKIKIQDFENDTNNIHLYEQDNYDNYDEDYYDN